MKKSDIQPLPAYFDRYIHRVDDLELDDAFQKSLDALANFDWATCEKIGDRTYAPDKWTIAQILQHLLDWERILTFRALIFARETGLKAQSFEEDLMAKSAAQNPSRSLDDLRNELNILRHATRSFFKSLSDADLQKMGLGGLGKISVLALGFTILGHQAHHFDIIRTRYF